MTYIQLCTKSLHIIAEWLCPPSFFLLCLCFAHMFARQWRPSLVYAEPNRTHSASMFLCIYYVLFWTPHNQRDEEGNNTKHDRRKRAFDARYMHCVLSTFRGMCAGLWWWPGLAAKGQWHSLCRCCKNRFGVIARGFSHTSHGMGFWFSQPPETEWVSLSCWEAPGHAGRLLLRCLVKDPNLKYASTQCPICNE